jgi:predicted negative regulator of RcsB-dependent stress response
VIAMSNSDRTAEPKDGWDKADILLKGVIAVLLPTAIAFYGYWTQRQTADRAEKAQKYEAAVQTLSNREGLVADLKARMFATLMEHYFKGTDAGKVAILELLAMNFDEHFQLRPLFEALNSELKDPREKLELQRVAQNMATREISDILAAGGQACDMNLEFDKAIAAPCAPIAVTLQQVQDDRIVVGTSSADPHSFEINYFDSPRTDHSTIGDLTYSLVLKSAKAGDRSASIKVAIFPRYSYSLQSRLALDQLMGRYLAPSVQFAPP